MGAHEPLQGGLFIGGVVVDVQFWIAQPELGHEVDEVFERTLLAGAVVPPEGAKADLAALTPGNTKKVFKAAIDEGVAFHVEEQVAVGRLGEASEAALRALRREKLVCNP